MVLSVKADEAEGMWQLEQLNVWSPDKRVLSKRLSPSDTTSLRMAPLSRLSETRWVRSEKWTDGVGALKVLEGLVSSAQNAAVRVSRIERATFDSENSSSATIPVAPLNSTI